MKATLTIPLNQALEIIECAFVTNGFHPTTVRIVDGGGSVVVVDDFTVAAECEFDSLRVREAPEDDGSPAAVAARYSKLDFSNESR